ncbi:MAG: hypothetical protein IKH57_17470 [Clostridia bacterium]|nr:hypothetical protein [Clostridia bacterium]
MRGSKAAQRYRRIDLSIFALMVILFESVAVLAATKWFPGQPYTVSVVPAVVAVVMIRWGPWAAVHAVLGGAVFCFMSGGGIKQYAVYCAGNLFALLSLFLVKALGGEEKVRTDVWKTMLYGLCAILLMQTGRGLTALLLGTPIEGIIGFYTTDVMSLLFTLMVLWIVRRLDGVLENQYHYLLRLQAEEEKDRGGLR